MPATHHHGTHQKGNGLRQKLVAGLLALGMAGCASRSAGTLTPVETILSATCLLASERAVGTGILVAMRNPKSPGEFLPVIVTASHLLKASGRRGLAVPLRVMDADGRLLLVVTLAAPSRKHASWYVTHPTLDVAAFELPLPESLPAPSYVPFVEEKNLEKASLRAGETVCFAGFPEGIPTSEGLFPVLRTGTVASLEQSLFALPYFLINGDVYAGDSGAPVFRNSQTGRPRIVGMVVQRLGPSGRTMPLALAINADAIRETLGLLAEKKRK